MKPEILLMVTITTLAATGPTIAEEASPGGFQVGILTCTSTPDSQKNLIVASSVELDCELKYNNGKVDHYSGKSGVAAGLDLNWKRSEVLKYAVLAASQDTTPGLVRWPGVSWVEKVPSLSDTAAGRARWLAAAPAI